MLWNCLKNQIVDFVYIFINVILQLIGEIISFDDIIWSFINLRNEHGVTQPLAHDVLGISKTPWN